MQRHANLRVAYVAGDRGKQQAVELFGKLSVFPLALLSHFGIVAASRRRHLDCLSVYQAAFLSCIPTTGAAYVPQVE
jgi:hypothetical protein